MQQETFDLVAKARRASEEELFRGLEMLTTDEHAVVLKLLVLLGELDERRAYAKKAYPSMFELCVRSLKYSEGQACRRIKAARAIRKEVSDAARAAGGTRNHADEFGGDSETSHSRKSRSVGACGGGRIERETSNEFLRVGFRRMRRRH